MKFKNLKYFLLAMITGAILIQSSHSFSQTIKTANVETKKKPRVAVIFPTDETNVNAIGNVLQCMVEGVFDVWRKNGFQFDTTFFNDRRDTMEAAKVAEAVGNGSFDVAIGTTLSSQALIVSKILNEYKTPFFAPLATHPDVVEGRPYSIRLAFSDRRQAQVLAKYSIHLQPNVKSILVIENMSIPYSTFLSQNYIREMSAYKNVKIRKLSYIDGQYKLSELLRYFKQEIPEIVFAPIYSLDIASTYATISPTIKEKTILLSSDAVGASSSFINSLGPDNKLLELHFVQHNPKEFTGKYASDFISIHNKKCGKYQLNMNAAAGYDLANATLMALFDTKFQKFSFKDRLINLKYEGVLGKLIFGSDGEPIKPLHMYTIKDSAVTYRTTIL